MMNNRGLTRVTGRVVKTVAMMAVPAALLALAPQRGGRPDPNAISGLLVRQVRYSNTPIGMVPTEVDYADYRDVAGVKLRFKIVITWTDGQSTILLNDVQPNVPIGPEKFAKPLPPVVK